MPKILFAVPYAKIVYRHLAVGVYVERTAQSVSIGRQDTDFTP
jgi:hypothetical protein